MYQKGTKRIREILAERLVGGLAVILAGHILQPHFLKIIYSGMIGDTKECYGLVRNAKEC